ncbi:MAG: lamin tail domain-containing protein [Rhodothermales bacterium]
MIAPRARLAFLYSCAALLLGLLLTGPVQAQNTLSGVLINEILADPNSAGSSQDCSTATTPCFDTNGSGAAEADDEFVELFNTSGLEVDISGWEIYDETGLQHTFPGTVDSGTTLLAAGGFAVVVSNYDSPPANFFEASSGSLSLNNGAETVYLRDPGTNTFVAASYNGDTPTNTPAGTPNGMFEAFGSDEDGQSIQRRPDGSTTFVVDTPNPAATNGGGAANAALTLTTVVDRADAVCSDPNDVNTCNLSSSSSSVTAAPGEKVVVRYTAENTGDVTLTTHDLVDSEEGVLLSNFSFDLMPGASVFIDNFSMASGMPGADVRTATWTAEDAEGTVAVGEDMYEIVVETPPSEFDFGDAPGSYATLLADGGARHAITSGVHLGALVDADADGQPSADGTGDDTDGTDDEDGVALPASLVAGATQPITVVASAAGFLSGFADWNGDGDFSDSGEQAFDDVALVPGPNTLSLAVPASAVTGTTFARFRFCSAEGDCDTSAGLAEDGEVEDYAVEVIEAACSESLIISDFAVFSDSNAFELRNTGAETVSLAGCSFVATYNDVYVSLDLGGGTLVPGGAIGFTPGDQFRNVFGGLALLDRVDAPATGTAIADVQPDIVASLVYLGHDVVYGFYHRDPDSFQAQCADYARARLSSFAVEQCAPLSRGDGSGQNGPVALTHAELTEAMLATERGATTSAETDALPTAFGVSAAYPNPMRERGTLTVDVPEAANVRVVVYDVLGRAVAVVLDEAVEAGRYAVSLDASPLAPGTYLVRMTASSFAQTQRVTIVR